MKKSVFYIISGLLLVAVIFSFIRFNALKPEMLSKNHLLEQYQKETKNFIALLDKSIQRLDTVDTDSALHFIQLDSLQQAVNNLNPKNGQSKIKKEADSILRNLHNALSDIDLSNQQEDMNLVKYKIKAIRDDYTHELGEVTQEKNSLLSSYNKSKKRIIVLFALTVLSLLIGLRINLYSKSPKH